MDDSQLLAYFQNFAAALERIERLIAAPAGANVAMAAQVGTVAPTAQPAAIGVPFTAGGVVTLPWGPHGTDSRAVGMLAPGQSVTIRTHTPERAVPFGTGLAFSASTAGSDAYSVDVAGYHAEGIASVPVILTVGAPNPYGPDLPQNADVDFVVTCLRSGESTAQATALFLNVPPAAV